MRTHGTARSCRERRRRRIHEHLQCLHPTQVPQERGRRRRGGGGRLGAPAKRVRSPVGPARQEALQRHRAYVLPGLQLAARAALAVAAPDEGSGGRHQEPRELRRGRRGGEDPAPASLQAAAVRLGAVPEPVLRRVRGDRSARAARRLPRQVRGNVGLPRLGDARVPGVLHQVGRQHLRDHARRRHPHPALSQAVLRRPRPAEEVLQALPARARGAEDLERVHRRHPVFHRGAEEPERLRHVHGGESRPTSAGASGWISRRRLASTTSTRT